MISLYLCTVKTTILTIRVSFPRGSKTLSTLLHFKSHFRVVSFFVEFSEEEVPKNINTHLLRVDGVKMPARNSLPTSACKRHRLENF